jgi:catecholate siderophore receptor
VTAASFTTADAMVEYLISESTTLKLNVTNLTDKLYADTLYRGFYAPGAARSIQVSLKTAF